MVNTPVRSRLLEDGTPVHGFDTLPDNLATIVRNRCRVPDTEASFEMAQHFSQKSEAFTNIVSNVHSKYANRK